MTFHTHPEVPFDPPAPPKPEPAVWSSPQIDQVVAALAMAKLEFAPVVKNSKAQIQTRSGGSYTYSYADLGAFIEACEEPLAKQGLVLVQMVEECDDRHVRVRSVLAHKSGQWIGNSFTLPVQTGRLEGAQAYGSAITFARRYSSCCILGLVGEDDDGKAASQPREQQRPQPRVSGPEYMDIVKAINLARTQNEVTGALTRARELDLSEVERKTLAAAAQKKEAALRAGPQRAASAGAHAGVSPDRADRAGA